MHHSWFFEIFYQKTSKLGFWVADWLSIKSKHLRDFLEISWFLKILTLMLFDSWGSLYIHFLVVTILVSVSLMVKRNCAKTWKSLQIFCPRLRVLNMPIQVNIKEKKDFTNLLQPQPASRCLRLSTETKLYAKYRGVFGT